MLDDRYQQEYIEYARSLVDGMIHQMERISPSNFVERTRYLPPSVTSKPGYFRFKTTPYMEEIVNCFDLRSAVREVNLMKGVQVGYTTALENVLLYVMDHVKTAPTMFMTADAELAKGRIENSIMPMLVLSGRSEIIQSSDPTNTRKTGKTDKQIQWKGGGYMIPFGANNANKMRMYSILYMLKDELDGWPDVVGKDGEPDGLSDDRCSAFWDRRKIFRGSTPLETESSKILKAFKRGDQRYYMVLCRSCNFPQTLRWGGTNKTTGHEYGMKWEMEEGRLLQESVNYVCQECAHVHYEYDKSKLFAKEEGAHWKPTAIPELGGIRSYHLNALYSPVGFQPWHKSVSSYLTAWDVKNKRVKDFEAFKKFYNNVLGEPFTMTGDKLNFQDASTLRRKEYRMGEFPRIQEHAIQYGGGAIQPVIMTVDVHKANLAVGIFGFTPHKCAYLIDYYRLTGPNDNSGIDGECIETWGEIRNLIEHKVYEDDDGRRYPISLTLVDSSYETDVVNTFCSNYQSSVYPIVGRESPPKKATIDEFWQFKTKIGIAGYGVIVDIYKDRMSMNLRRFWDGRSEQPWGHFNAPVDASDKVMRELIAETKREKKDPKTNKVIGSEWHRPGGKDNELWDLLGYAMCGLDMCAYDMWRSDYRMKQPDETPINWEVVFNYMNDYHVYWIPPEK
jgi:phage terminase large subunit GpA-like protein